MVIDLKVWYRIIDDDDSEHIKILFGENGFFELTKILLFAKKMAKDIYVIIVANIVIIALLLILCLLLLLQFLLFLFWGIGVAIKFYSAKGEHLV